MRYENTHNRIQQGHKLIPIPLGLKLILSNLEELPFNGFILPVMNPIGPHRRPSYNRSINVGKSRIKRIIHNLDKNTAINTLRRLLIQRLGDVKANEEIRVQKGEVSISNTNRETFDG